MEHMGYYLDLHGIIIIICFYMVYDYSQYVYIYIIYIIYICGV